MAVYYSDNAVVAAKAETTFGTKAIFGDASWIGIVPSAKIDAPIVEWQPFWTLGEDRDMNVQVEGRNSLTGIEIPVTLQNGEIIRYAYNGYLGTTTAGVTQHTIGETLDISGVNNPSGATNSPNLPSLTLEASYADPVLSGVNPGPNFFVRFYLGAKINTIVFKVDDTGELAADVGFVAATTTTGASLRSLPVHQVLSPYMFHQGSVVMWGQTIARIIKFQLTVKNNLTPLWFLREYLGNNTGTGKNVSDIVAGRREYELTGELVLDNTVGTAPGGANTVWGTLIGGATFNVTLTFLRSGTAFSTSSDAIQFALSGCALLKAPMNIPAEKGEIRVPFVIRPRKCVIDIRNTIAPSSFVL